MPQDHDLDTITSPGGTDDDGGSVEVARPPTSSTKLKSTFESYVRCAEAAESDLDEALRVLSALARLEAAVHDHTDRVVADCRSHSASWSEVGEALGMTRQSAHARFARAERGLSRHHPGQPHR